MTPKEILIEYRHIVLLAFMAVIAIYVYLDELPYLSPDNSRNVVMGICLLICIIYFLVYVQFVQKPQPTGQMPPVKMAPARKRDVFEGFDGKP